MIASWGLLEKYLDPICSHCKTGTGVQYMCGSCKGHLYCGSKCEYADRKEHQLECPLIGQLLGNLDANVLLNVAQFLNKTDIGNLMLVAKVLTQRLGRAWIQLVEWRLHTNIDPLTSLRQDYVKNIRTLRIDGPCTHADLQYLGEEFTSLRNLKISRYIGDISYFQYMNNVNVSHLAVETFDNDDRLDFRMLPASLIHLELPDQCRTTVRNLPPKLKFLRFIDDYVGTLDFLPDTIQYLDIGVNYTPNVGIIERLPARLKELRLARDHHHNVFRLRSMDVLPQTLEMLYYRDTGFWPTPFWDYNQLPRSLRDLDFRVDFSVNKPLAGLPESLESLRVMVDGDGQDSELEVGELPANLRRLYIGDSEEFGFTLRFTFPNFPTTLETLTLGDCWLPTLPKLPDTLQVLDIRRINNTDTFQLPPLPRRLKVLRLPKDFKQPIFYLPSTVEEVYLNSRFKALIFPGPEYRDIRFRMKGGYGPYKLDTFPFGERVEF